MPPLWRQTRLIAASASLNVTCHHLLRLALTAQRSVTQQKQFYFLHSNNIYNSADLGHATLLVSLDLNTAFKTIDQFTNFQTS